MENMQNFIVHIMKICNKLTKKAYNKRKHEFFGKKKLPVLHGGAKSF